MSFGESLVYTYAHRYVDPVMYTILGLSAIIINLFMQKTLQAGHNSIDYSYCLLCINIPEGSTAIVYTTTTRHSLLAISLFEETLDQTFLVRE